MDGSGDLKVTLTRPFSAPYTDLVSDDPVGHPDTQPRGPLTNW